jgi:hypothetical protein
MTRMRAYNNANGRASNNRRSEKSDGIHLGDLVVPERIQSLPLVLLIHKVFIIGVNQGYSGYGLGRVYM